MQKNGLKNQSVLERVDFATIKKADYFFSKFDS